MLQRPLVHCSKVGCIGLSHCNDTISKPWQHLLILAKHFRMSLGSMIWPVWVWQHLLILAKHFRRREWTDKPDRLKLLNG